MLTLDGSGEDVSTQIAVGRGERLVVEESIPVPHSLGWYYGAFTAYFGFAPYRHEGKLMALAGLGAARSARNPWPERLAKVLNVGERGYEVDPIFTRFGDHTHSDRFTDALASYITGFDPDLAPRTPAQQNGAAQRLLDPAWVDLAYGVQSGLEAAAKTLAVRCAERFGTKNLCIAGGVGLNCKMNGALLHETPVERLFVQPASHDAGAAIGAAMVVAEGLGDPVPEPARARPTSGLPSRAPRSRRSWRPATCARPSAPTSQRAPPRSSLPGARSPGSRAGSRRARAHWARVRSWPTPGSRAFRCTSTV